MEKFSYFYITNNLKIKKMKKEIKKTYWEERYESLPNYIVVGEDMDGIVGYTVVHKKDEREFRSGCYNGSIMNGLSMNKAEMQKLADEMNK
jgi:hypothetical protein